MILLFSLFSPIAELFPNLYMSWWVPTNGKLKDYLQAWPRRVIVVLVVWLPILLTLGLITSTPVQLFISTLVFTAFGLRLYFFDRALHQTSGTDADFIEPNNIPEALYFIAFSSIAWVLYQSVPDRQWLVLVAISLLLFGAFMMATFRRGPRQDLRIDVIGRVVFTSGFLLNLFNIARAALLI